MKSKGTQLLKRAFRKNTGKNRAKEWIGPLVFLCKW